MGSVAERQGDGQIGCQVAPDLYQTDVYLAADVIVPYQQPADVDGNVDHNHPLDAVAYREIDTQQLDDTKADVAPHIGRGMAASDNQAGEEVAKRAEGSHDAQQLQQQGALQPLGSEQDDDELAGYQSQAEHGGKRHEGCEAQQLAEYLLLALAVLVGLGKHGLGYAVEHVADERPPHVVPLVGLGVVAYDVSRVLPSQDDAEHVGVDDDHHAGDNQLAAEGKHLLDGREING